ncbi:transglutaminase domain-containing protein [Collinsella tanakaei]|uniref:transglutaminase domain-containing protein n=1 Tax=Collinsella tanakaei TaxID=626935 RepID=UPI0025A3D82F|nr:transglutaminase domain-containing protein [Collinsella tanakaei]MDM8300685.1 transglutaminase domain-containing protein [Collinsella tanakaei]
MPLLSESLHAYADRRLAARQELLAPLAGDIKVALESLDDRCEQTLLKLYLGTLPLTDVFDTDLDVLVSYARQARELRASSPWCKDVPERVFVHYVACPRVNNEPLTDAWPVFRAALAERVADLDADRAILETNYWCAETATYQASDGRTLGPLGVLASGDGRCGEESTYLVCALRSLGIPARQIYTPWWAHCDDNHAWVEAYADGTWYYLGACEPEEALDRGWFTAASGRAMLVHTRLFGDYGCDFEGDRHLLSREGNQVIVNLTGAYAPTTLLTVSVRDAAGSPVQGASVRLRLVNEASWRDIAHLTSDANGTAEIVVGKGTLRIVATTADGMAEQIIDTTSCSAVELTLGDTVTGDTEWVDFDVHAPVDHPAPCGHLTPEQAEIGRVRKREADRMRTERVAGNVERARELARTTGHGEDACLPFFEQAFANAGEVARFLSADDGADRAALLGTLTSKDFRDLDADVLEDHILGARAVRDGALAYLAREGVTDAEAAQDLYVRYVLCPRAHFEHLSAYRGFIRSFFDAEQAAAFTADPMAVWTYICDTMSFDSVENVKKLVGTPRGALLSRQASAVTRRSLFVAICRSFGIPARINPIDAGIEFFAHGEFVPVEHEERGALVAFASDADPAPGYFQAWSVARYLRFTAVSGKGAQGFKVLDFWGKAPFEDGICRLKMPYGEYRLTTAVRLPNGDVQASERAFAVVEGAESEPIELKLREPNVSEMLADIALDAFAVRDEASAAVDPARIALAGDSDAHPVIVAFLEPGMEPTEHLLNEMREQADRLAAARVPVVLVVRDADALADPTLARTLPQLSNVTVAYDDFSELPERLARRMFANPEKLPLSILAEAGADGALTGRYAVGGYNVGSVDLMLKLIALAK